VIEQKKVVAEQPHEEIIVEQTTVAVEPNK